jgi:hypothetical protein
LSEDEKLVANERTKLLATYVNNLAVGTLVAGFLRLQPALRAVTVISNQCGAEQEGGCIG